MSKSRVPDNFMEIPSMPACMKADYLQEVSGDDLWTFRGIGDCKMYFNSKGRWILCVQYYGAKRLKTRMYIPSNRADQWEEVLKRNTEKSEE